MTNNEKKNDKTEDRKTVPEKPEEKNVSEKKENHNEQIQQMNSRILRLNADFDNFRKRADKEKTERYYAGKESVLSKMIGFIDVFNSAIEMTKNAEDSKKVLDGLELLKKEFTCFIEKEGVKEIKSEGQKFDPFLYEAVGFDLTDLPEEENKIVREVSKGYMFNDRVLRHPKVIILKNSDKAQEKQKAQEQQKEGGN